MTVDSNGNTVSHPNAIDGIDFVVEEIDVGHILIDLKTDIARNATDEEVTMWNMMKAKGEKEEPNEETQILSVWEWEGYINGVKVTTEPITDKDALFAGLEVRNFEKLSTSKQIIPIKDYNQISF